MHLSPLQYSALWILATLAFLNCECLSSQLKESSGLCLGSPLLCCSLGMLSKQKLRLSLHAEIVALGWLLFHVWKPLFHIFFSWALSCLRQENNSSLHYSHHHWKWEFLDSIIKGKDCSRVRVKMSFSYLEWSKQQQKWKSAFLK